MIISIGFVGFIVFALVVIGVFLTIIATERDSFSAFLTGVILLIISIFLVFQIYRNIPKIEEPNKESFYEIVKVEFEDGTSKQISILPNGKTIDITNIGESKIYPENSILRRYGYKAESGWIKYDNENKFYYEIITPNSEKYKEAKEKVIEVKISELLSKNNIDEFPELEKEELYDCYINREEEKL